MNRTGARFEASLLGFAIVGIMLAGCSTNNSATTSADGSTAAGPTSATASPTSATASTTDDSVTNSTDDGSVIVTIKGFKFAPDPITVSVEDSVTWTNEDPVGHTVTARDASFKTGMFFPDDSATVTFATAGTFQYFCSAHPEMTGTVIVQTATG